MKISDFRTLPPHIELFIGGRDKNSGNFTPHISPDMSPDNMRIFVAETFDLVPVDDQDEETPSQSINLDMAQVLHGIVNHFLEGIRAENNFLFKRFIDYDRDGIFRSFARSYQRIRDGKIQPSITMQEGLDRLFKHYHSEFNNAQDFVPNPQHNPQSHGTKQYVSNVNELTESFSILVNVLLMSIFCEYHADPEHFQRETLFRDDIQKIKNRIRSFLTSTPLSSDHTYQQYVMKNRLWNFDQYKLIEKVTGQHVTDTDALHYLVSHMRCDKDYVGNDMVYFDLNSDYKKYSIQFVHNLDHHFNALIDMYGLINMVESIYLDYKAKSFGDSPNRDVTPVQYQLLINILCSQ